MTLTQVLAGSPVLGTVMAVSVMLTSATPSVGGLYDDFEPFTSNTFTMPCSMWDLPSGAGMKQNRAYRPAGSSAIVVVDWSGPRKPGVPTISSETRNSSPADSSSESSAVLTCFTVVFGFTWAMPIMWYSTPGLLNSISTKPGFGAPDTL